MKIKKKLAKRKQRRAYRVHNRIRESANGRPRLSVYRSNKHIYAQIIDDEAGKTLVAASTVKQDVSGAGSYAGNRACAEKVGRLIAERAVERGIKQVVFDRGIYQYHGRVAALAEAARQGGLSF